MKKIMFNDRYGLTQAVLEGRKTMTRRIAGLHPDNDMDNGDMDVFDTPKYKLGEVVAVAQAYKDVPLYPFDPYVDDTPGWKNKMFVRADLMPHQIRITNVRVERLQDISDEDCMKEGIYVTEHHSFGYPPSERQRTFRTAVFERFDAFTTPQNAFAALIDKVSGKGTWASNPWVFVYEFELLK